MTCKAIWNRNPRTKCPSMTPSEANCGTGQKEPLSEDWKLFQGNQNVISLDIFEVINAGSEIR